MSEQRIKPEISQKIKEHYEDIALTLAMDEELEQESISQIIEKFNALLPLLGENINFAESQEQIISVSNIFEPFRKNVDKKYNGCKLDQAGDIKKLQEEISKMISTSNKDSIDGEKSADQTPNKTENVKINGDELEIYKEFVTESLEHLETIEEKILLIEEEPNNVDLINEVFRPFHSMKGSAGFIGLTQINMLAHETETLLDYARKGQLIIRRNSVDTLLKAIDILKQLVFYASECIEQEIAPPEASDIDIFPTIEKVKAIVAARNIAEQDIGDILIENGDINSKDLEQAVLKQNMRIGEILVDQGSVSNKNVDKALNIQKAQGKKIIGSIKVDVKKLDALMELVGELVISHTLISQHPSMSEEISAEVVKEMSNLGKICNGIQENVMSIRMVVLKQTFHKMNRLVRDLSQKTGKKIGLAISGENTEIDKTIIDKINDPLVHLIRNSIDHGIEIPSVRESAGKPSKGTVGLNAFHSGGKVVIEIKDDGKGLSKELILRKAIEKGVADKETSYSDQQIMNFIFQAGFSTVEKATEISGRGVGMDVVKQNIESLSGKVEVNSEEGVGSTFTIRLPLTTAIVDGMVVKVDNERYIIPTIAIRETISPKKDEIITIKNKGEMIKVRGEVISIIRLHRLLKTGTCGRKPWKSLVVIVESEEKKHAIMVDDLLGQQQVVIKSLGKKLKDIKGVSGAAILGDGKVGLILDIGGIVSLT